MLTDSKQRIMHFKIDKIVEAILKLKY